MEPDMDPIDVTELTVADIQAGLAAGHYTCEALTQAYLARIARFNPRYNAIIIPNPDALADARAIDRRRAAGETLPPLAGVPVVIKDPMDMAGIPTTGGWSLLHGPSGGVDLVPEVDSPVVARMRAAGTIMLGKTNVPVLSASGTHANDSWAGPTLNAAAPDRAPGASSAGTATAIAASFCVLGLAEETGGSIQNPAAAQGLVGIKPTHALVPNTGVLPLSSMRDVVGPIARCVRDAALCLDVLAGFTMADPKTVASIGRIPAGGYTAALRTDALADRRLGLYGPGWRDEGLSPETEDLYRAAQDVLSRRGATLVTDPFAGTAFAQIARERPGGSRYDWRGMESVPHDLENYLRRLGPKAALRSFAEFAAATTAQDPFAPTGALSYVTASPVFQACRAHPAAPPDMSEFARVRATYLDILHATLDAHGIDALVFPQMREALPPRVGEATIRATTVSEINIAGLPGVVVPAGTYADGTPFCLIFVGRPWSEGQLLALAFDYEQATRHRRAPELQA
jgi:Asp-tRNA(Asn)/Glu-tRNA(Gln) amidotransferase A subunit family amidase